MTSTCSTFFDSIGAGGNEGVEQSMREYFQLDRDIDYKTKPNYGALLALLLQLNVVAAAKSSAPVSVRKRSQKSARKSTRSAAICDEDVLAMHPGVQYDDDEEEQDFESAYRSMPNDFATAREDDDDNDDVHETAPMDLEPLEESSPDENIAPNPRRGVKDYSLEIIKGQTEAVYMGSDPTAKEGGTEYDLPDDPHIDETHIKFELQANKHLQSVDVTDLSSSGTIIDNCKIHCGKDNRAFLGDTICFRDSMIKIEPLTDKTQAVEMKKAATKMSAVAKRTTETLVSCV